MNTRPDKRYVNVKGKQMAYVEMGSGDPIVFQHGNPTSSYLWRNIMPALADRGRCIAVDLIGMGDSDKLDDTWADRYTYAGHREFLFEAWDALGIADNVTLVIHDWGSALGFDWAARHPDKVRGIAYMEAIVCPLEWSDWPEGGTEIFKAFRSDAGELIVLEKNVFVERVLPSSILRDLSDEEMNEYRRPFTDVGDSRLPTLTWPRQIPLDGKPEDVNAIVGEYSKWLAEAEVPKLFINADPGSILVGRQREFCRGWPKQTEVTVKGLHFIQEDSPEEIGAAIAVWVDGLD